jgi:hypothetical protein
MTVYLLLCHEDSFCLMIASKKDNFKIFFIYLRENEIYHELIHYISTTQTHT